MKSFQVLVPKSKLGLFNYKNELIAARNLFREGKSKEGRALFEDISKNIGGSKLDSLINILIWLMEKFRTVTTYAYGKHDADKLKSCIDLVKELEPSLSETKLKFKNITMTDINKSVFNCRLGAEMAILSNVIAFYCSHLRNYEMAAKLYGAAYCFAYNNIELKLATLRNLKKSYKKLGNLTNVTIVDEEIQKLELETIDEPLDLPVKKAG